MRRRALQHRAVYSVYHPIYYVFFCLGGRDGGGGRRVAGRLECDPLKQLFSQD